MHNRCMKICILSTMFLRYPKDTRGLSIYEYAKGIHQQGVEVSVVAPNDAHYPSYEKNFSGLEAHRFHYFIPGLERVAYGSGIPTNLRHSLLAWIQMPFFMSAFFFRSLGACKKADIIHTQWILSGVVGILVGKILRKPVCYTVRGIAIPNWYYKAINRWVINRADHVFFNSSYTRDETLKFCKPKSSSIVRPTVDVKKFHPGVKSSVYSQYKKAKKPVIFSLGLLVEKKGFTYLIGAMTMLKNKEAVLVIGGEGTERKHLEGLIIKYKLSERVKLVGTIDADKTPAYFAGADLFVLPSIVDRQGETETLGVVLLEAMASGCPVVATRVGGIPDVVHEGTGVLVEQKNPKQLAEAIDNLLAEKKKRMLLGKKGRGRMLSHFVFDAVNAEIKKTYDVLISL